jgi:hypothetical protein
MYDRYFSEAQRYPQEVEFYEKLFTRVSCCRSSYRPVAGWADDPDLSHHAIMTLTDISKCGWKQKWMVAGMRHAPDMLPG